MKAFEVRKRARGFVWRAQYFLTCGPGRKAVKVSGFFGAQVNAADFSWHLQYAGRSMSPEPGLLCMWQVQ